MPRYKDPNPNHIGERLRVLIDQSGLYPAAVARRAGMDRQTLHNILKGVRNPGLDTIERLLAAIGMRLSALDAPTAPLPRPDGRCPHCGRPM